MTEQRQVEFASNQLPVLVSGKYSLALTHTLGLDSGNQTFGNQYAFQVQSERFSISPKEILKVFPPPNTLGTFDNVLPHVVLSRRTLPWEREPQAPRQATDNGPAYSWLAVLVFAGTAAPALQTGTLADLVPASASGNLPTDAYSYGSVFPSMDDFLEVGEASSDACVYIDVPLAFFAALAPSQADLLWNAHVRSTASSDGTFSNLYSVVVSNTLPTAGQSATAHLVSFEGLWSQLPNDDGSYTTAPPWSTMRLVTLKSWQFRVAPLEASFQHVLLGLNGGVGDPSTAVTENGDSLLRLPSAYVPAAAPDSAPAMPFASGYTVLAGGDDVTSASWYRGPFAPSTVTPNPAGFNWAAASLPANSAASLAVSVSTAPASDQSYAVAWQLGRLLALADKDFATAQVSWKRDARLSLNTLLGQQNDLRAGGRAAYAALVRAVLKDPDQIRGVLGSMLSVDGANDSLIIPQTLVDWLANLALLKIVPFNYLVPDSKMMPPESLRFFNVDPRWIACLLDGAWSLDRQPAANWAFDTAYQPWQQLQAGTLVPSFAGSGSWWPSSGALLNSQVIPGYWPGIEFETAPQVSALREDLLGASALILLFNGSLTSLTLKQPSEGIHFGFDIDEDGVLSKPTRYLSVGGQLYPKAPSGPPPSPGDETPASYTLTPIPQRSASVIQFDNLAQAIQKTIGLPAIRAVDFAVELVESVSSVQFTLPAGA